MKQVFATFTTEFAGQLNQSLFQALLNFRNPPTVPTGPRLRATMRASAETCHKSMEFTKIRHEVLKRPETPARCFLVDAWHRRFVRKVEKSRSFVRLKVKH